ncbi:T9SS type A sorting domain-containing protein [uncultured Draconibacterium sp.]|uniref:T9SS type A sorting domain-containing protein n=1 Tax=uncultured Draconibacterium sp. TaxID=1573823 RepID=UPI0032172D79
MKFILTIFIIIISLNVFGQVGALVWEDNFNTGQLDLSKWSYETGTGVNGDFGTGQLDRATERTTNVSFQNAITGAEDGCLVITTQKEFYIDRNYTSGRINTAGKASWGPGHRIVARVFPRDVKQMGQGFAFWMMPDEIPASWDYLMWPQGGEVDIMEYVGSIPYHNLGSVHYAWFWQNNQWVDWNHGHMGAYYSYEKQEVPLPAEPGYGNYPPTPGNVNAGSAGFHTYGIDWYADRMEFFVDDNVYHIHYFNDGDAFYKDGQDGFNISATNGKRVAVSEYSNHFSEWYPFEHKMYPILSAGVGGSQNTYGGAVVSEAQFPCSVFIDWVKVYKLDTEVGVENREAESMFAVYPNPASDLLYVQIKNPENYWLRISDSSGKIQMEKALDETATINTSELKSGLYLVSLTNSEITHTKTIIIQ